MRCLHCRPRSAPHFESRDGLVAAVLRRALESLQAELAGGMMVLDDYERGSGVMINRAFEVLVDRGHGRLLGWLALTYPAGHEIDEQRRDLRMLARMAHSARERTAEGPFDPRDTAFVMISLRYAMLGAAVFERGTFVASGFGEDQKVKAELREWLRELIVHHLETRTVD